MEAFRIGIAAIFDIYVLAALAAGALGGVILGAIPGLGPVVAIAILLPATFQMEPLVGLTLLLGVYSGSWYGGAIPAILINTPGTPVNVLTTYDGYPMTLRGEARRALTLAYTSSFVGGIVSVLALALFAAPLAAIASNFGSPEFAMAAVSAIVLVILAHRGATLPAMAMVGAGLFLSTVGLEQTFYSQRYTFGQQWLLSGFPLIPIGLGLFAVSQGFILLSGGQSPPKVKEPATPNYKTLFEVFTYPVTLFRSAGFGVIMGVLPGVGEWMAQFFSYTAARSGSKTPEMFGKGAPEGLIASETANNAVPAAAMVPLLSLGLPGEALTAMMLAVFTVHNVFPGPTLFETRPDFIYGLYGSLFLINIVAFLFLLAFGRWIAQVTRLNYKLIGAGILVFAFAGVYTANYNLNDCYLALAFGLIGVALRRAGMPMVPILLGVVLGPILENRLRQAIGTSGSAWVFLERPISLVFVCLMLLAIGLHFYALQRNARARSMDANKQS